LRVRLKGKAGDLGGARSGKAGEDHGERCAASGARRKKAQKKGGAAERGQVVRERDRESAGRRRVCADWAERGGAAGPREWGGERKGEKRATRGKGKENGPRGKRPARGGGEEQAELGWNLGLLFYFPSFFFSNQFKSI
jgi:hypothetical protein